MSEIWFLSGCDGDKSSNSSTSPRPAEKPNPANKTCPEGTVYVPPGKAVSNNFNTTYLSGASGDRIAYMRFAQGVCFPKGPVTEMSFRIDDPFIDRKPYDPATSVSFKAAQKYCASRHKRLPKPYEIIHAYHQGRLRELRAKLSFVRSKPYAWMADKDDRGKHFRVGFQRDKYGVQYLHSEITERYEGSRDTSFFCVADPKPASPPMCDKNASTQKITFVHTNDLHGSFTPEEDGGNPVARISGYCKQVRKDNPFALCTHGGDIYEKGDVTELISSGRTTRAVFGALGFDVAVVGNHDLAWSLKEFFAYSRTFGTMMLASNVKYVGQNPAEYGGVDYAIADVGCVRVGFFGMVSKGYDERDEQTDQDYYPEALATRHDYERRAREMVAKLKGKVDLIVMVSHVGIEEDRKLAKAVPGIDVILSSHSHDAVTETINGVPILQADAYANYIGRLDLIYDLKKRRLKKHEMRLFPNRDSFLMYILPSDEEVRKNVNSMVQIWMPKDEFAYVYGTLGDKSAVAGVVAKSIVYYLKSKKGVEAQAAFVDTKTVWTDQWEKGPLTIEELAESFKVERQPAGTPGFSSFYTVEVSGIELDLFRRMSIKNSRWKYSGPSEPDPLETYTLALPKKVALNLRYYMERELGHEFEMAERDLGDYIDLDVKKPQHACEIWEAVHVYGQHRTDEGLYIDEDKQLT